MHYITKIAAAGQWGTVAERTARDRELVARVKRGDRAASDELKRHYQNLVFSKTNVYGRSTIPREILEAEGWRLFWEAVREWEPSRGALSTHLGLRLSRLDRYVKSHQNMARISENNAALIGKIDRARGELEVEHGRDIPPKLLAQRAGIGLKRLKQIEDERISDLYQSGMEVEQHADRASHDRLAQVLEEFRLNLTDPRERAVYDHLVGTGGKRVVESKGQLAARIGVSPGRLSQLIKKISGEIEPYVHRAMHARAY